MSRSNQEQTLFPLDDFQLTEVSFSKLSLFLQCKFRYKAKHIDNVLRQDQRPTYYLTVGRVMHNILAKMYSPNRLQKEYDRESLRWLLSNAWIPDGFDDEGQSQEWFSRCLDILVRIIEEGTLSGDVLLVEEQFKEQIDKYLLASRVDRIDRIGEGECHIIDYKVGRSEVPYRSAAHSFQWVFHYLTSRPILEERFGLRVSRVSFYYLVADEFISFEPAKDIVDQRLEKILEIVSRIENETEFPPTINRYCADCRFDKICPAIARLKERGISLESAIRHSDSVSEGG